MKLQVGSGDHRAAPAMYKRADWCNVDIIKIPGVNVRGTGIALPFKDNSFEEIHCVHVLEHVTRDKYQPMLAEMYRVLKPGGNMYVETPDLKGTIDNLHTAMLCGNERAIHVWTTSIYGKSERDGMAHHWGFYDALLRREFREVGLRDVVRLTEKEDMISPHWRQEPVLLVRGVK